jgi:hypothetical protein
VFTDPFDDPTRWTTVETEAGSIGYAEGTLQITIADAQTALTSSRALPDPVPVMRLEADVTLSAGDGAIGLGCGTGGDTPDDLVGAVTTRNTWRVSTIVGETETMVAEGPLPLTLDLAGGGSASLGVECADTGTDQGDRIAIWVDGQVVGDTTTGSSLGRWSRAVVRATVAEPALVAFVDDAVADVGDTYAPAEADPAVLELLASVPSAWRDSCVPLRTVGDEAIVAGIVCAPAGEAEQAEYYRLTDRQALDAAFAQRVADARQALDAGDCAIGPSELTWSVPGGASGRVACHDNRDTLGGRVIVWTDEPALVLALGVRTTGGYPELYDWWLGAGPDA